MTSVESPSTMALVIPSQCRILWPISRAQNSVALLVEFPRLPVYSQMILPLLSLITPPIHVCPGLPFDAPLKLSLREPSGGGFQLRSPTCSCSGHLTVLGLHPSFSWKASRILRSRSVSCAPYVQRLWLCTISLVMAIIVSLIFPTVQLWFLKMHLFLSFQIAQMIMSGVRV